MNSKNSSVKKPASKKELKQPPLDIRQEEGFNVSYANHVAVVQTGFDAKVTFGRIDPGTDANVVQQHNAVVLPWPAVKTLLYLLEVAVVTQEEANGHIPYPQGGLIAPADALPEDIVKAYPKAKAIHEKVLKVWSEFLAANPEAQAEKPKKSLA